ncbi:MAG: aminoacyl-tRNA hydrolase [Alphaproteobacteria bacterium]
MKLLVGLGNPGQKYAAHRHNIGFMVIDALAAAHGFGPAKTRFQGEAREGALPGPGGGQDKVLLLKPTTFMNESGRAVGEAARFYRLTVEDVIVFHDELDLEAGRIRVKRGGGNAGHNGLRSISAHLGNEYWRVRIGIGHPGHKDRVSGHVLGDFAKAEREGWVRDVLEAMAAEADRLIGDKPGFASAVGQRLSPPAPRSAPPAGQD